MATPFQRRLAAIMFTDIEGYTALMQRSERSALQLRERHREVFTTITDKHRGQIIQYYGDGTLSVFESAVEAVRCAQEMQLLFGEDPALPVRIGIHVGDILISKDDIVGDGVNIAARLESIATAGSIVFSDPVRRDITNQDDLQVVSLGTYQFRNVVERMEVFALSNAGMAVPTPEEIRRCLQAKIRTSATPVAYGSKGWLAPTVMVVLLLLVITLWNSRLWNPGHLTDRAVSAIPSLLVLPFENLSDDLEQDYLADGIASEIRAKLSGIRELRVVSRASSMYYKDKRLPVSQLGKELGVSNVLEGTVQHAGGELKISVQLSNTGTDQLVWSSAAFHGKMEDIFAIQERIAWEVAEQLKVKLSVEEERNLLKRYTNDPQVYDLALLAESTRDEDLWQQVLAMDSNYAPAYLHLASLTTGKAVFTGKANPDSCLKVASAYLDRALVIDPDYSEAVALSANLDFYFRWDFTGAERKYQRAISSSEYALFPYLHLLMLTGRLEEAAKFANGLQSYEHLTRRWVGKGLVLFLENNYIEAINNLQIALKRSPDYIQGIMHLGQVYVAAGMPDSASLVLERGFAVVGYRPPFMLAHLAIAYSRTNREEEAKIILNELKTRWEQTGSSGSPAFCLGMVYSALDQKEQAFAWLEKSYAARELEMIWLKMEPSFRSLHGDPRYEDLLRQVGFPEEVKG